MTTTTTLTSLQIMTPTEQLSGTSFSTVPLETQSEPNTPVAPRDRTKDVTIVMPGAKDTNYYRAGLGSMAGVISGSFISCFKPVWSYFGKSTSNRSLEDDWEIPFETITNLEWVGAGIQGAVFKGVLNGKTVAVKKVMQPEITNIKHLRDLEHPNIIKFMGVCTQAPVFAIVMDFCERGQLCQALKSDMEISSDRWTSWSRQIAEGMHYLHRNKVIHRDLKSPNILLSTEDHLKICDFGTSAVQEKLNNSVIMSFCGTVNWMAPEMIKKEPCSEKVDVFSFGVVMWELMTRQQPYKNLDQMAVIYGVGTNNLSLPIPDTAPDGLKVLLKQCWSSKARNRPSFNYLLQHLDVLAAEIKEMGEENWVRLSELWRMEAQNIQYPRTLSRNSSVYGDMQDDISQQELQLRRRQELKHAIDIRQMYQVKLDRVNKMMDHLEECMENLALKKQLFNMQKRGWEEQTGMRSRGSSFSGCGHGRPHVARRQNDHLISNFDGGYEQMVSSEEEFEEYSRDSPYRCSQASSSSGFPSSNSACFSRQSSARSSSGMRHKSSDPRLHCSPSLRDSHLRHSYSSQHWSGAFVRGTPTRNSAFSEDSGVLCDSCDVLNMGTPNHPPTLYRNTDGRWSDGRISQRRRPSRKTSFNRECVMRTPQARQKSHRASFPPKHQPSEDCDCPSENCGNRKMRAKSMYDRSQHSPTPYDNPEELDVANLPHSSSYQEALRASEPPFSHSVLQKEFSQGGGYTNPIYTSPITTYTNPLASPTLNNKIEVHRSFTQAQKHISVVDDNVDLMSSLDSNNPRAHIGASTSDASADDEMEENGNVLNSSLDSERSIKTFGNKHSSSDDEAMDKRRRELMITSSSTMTSSLERSLELGAMKSDGLTDNEMKVAAVKSSIRGHRRTHSHPQAMIMSVVAETSTDDSEGAVEI